jgi:hypothetical protein
MLASNQGHVNIIMILLGSGATLDATSAEYLLLKGAWETWTELVKAALASGASSNTRITEIARARNYFPRSFGDNTTAL